MPNRWEYDIKTLTIEQIHEAVNCDIWQAFRVSLKGLSTDAKLAGLEAWLLANNYTCDHCTGEIRQRQVDNYINALKRGGQLDLEGNVVR